MKKFYPFSKIFSKKHSLSLLSDIGKFFRQRFFMLSYFLFVLPLGVIGYGVSVQDAFIVVLGAIFLVVLLLLVMPSLLAGKHLRLPSKKKTNTLLPKVSLPEIELPKVPSLVKIGRKKQSPLFGLISLMVFTLGLTSVGVASTIVTLFWLPARFASSLLMSYYQAWWSFLPQQIVFFIAGVLLTAVIGLVLWNVADPIRRRKLQFGLAQRLLFLTVLVAAGTAVGFHLGLMSAIGWYGFQLKQFAGQLQKDPVSMGVISDTDSIKDHLRHLSVALSISQRKALTQEQLIQELSSQGKYSQFYNQQLLSYLPAWTKPTLELPDSDLLLVGSHLLVSEIKEDRIEAISPPLGRAMVKHYFDPRNILDEPKIDVISRQEYLKFRDDLINDQLAEIDGQIRSVDGQIAGKYRAQDEVIIQWYYDEISYEEASSRYYALENQIAALRQKRGELQQTKKLIAAQKDIAPAELGIFLHEDKNIKVVLDVTGEESLDDYLAVLIHEYLHYTSFVDEERRLITFFEEGLTEYFSREVLKSFGVEAEVGYPIMTKVIEAIAQKVPQDKLAEAYFTKNEDLLKSILNQAFGSDFYEDSEAHFIMMPFSDRDTQLKFANDILLEIGAEPLKEVDFKFEE